MLSIRSASEMERVLEMPLDPLLAQVLRHRRHQLGVYDGYDLGDLARFIIVEPGDRLDAIEAELGFPIMTNFVDGSRYGDPGFEPSWEWIEHHSGWFELAFILSDDGFGHVLVVEDSNDTNADLLRLCRSCARPPC